MLSDFRPPLRAIGIPLLSRLDKTLKEKDRLARRGVYVNKTSELSVFTGGAEEGVLGRNTVLTH
jgi:hypothetical protein